MNTRDISKKASYFAGKAAKKGASLLEIGKLKMKIASEEKAIEDLYCKIGKTIYGLCLENIEIPENTKEDCMQIYEKVQIIKEYQQAIDDSKTTDVIIDGEMEDDSMVTSDNDIIIEVEPEPEIEIDPEDFMTEDLEEKPSEKPAE